MSDTPGSDRQGPFDGRRRDALWLGGDVWAHEDAGWEIRSIGPSGREVDHARSPREAGITLAWWARRVVQWVLDVLGPQTVGTLTMPAAASGPPRRQDQASGQGREHALPPAARARAEHGRPPRDVAPDNGAVGGRSR